MAARQVEGNKWQSPPEQIIAEGADGMLDFLRRVYDAYETGRLDLSERGLTVIPVELLSGTGRLGLDEKGALIPHLIALNLSQNEFTELSSDIAELTALTDLRLTGNSLEEIPPTAMWLTFLETLHIDDNELTTLPVDLGKLLRLRDLQMSVNRLSFFPESIGNLHLLTELVCEKNRVNYIPPTLSGLGSLVIFSLESNDIELLPFSAFQHFTACMDLNLSINKLKKVPSEIEHMTALTKLRVNNNELTDLPSGLKFLDPFEPPGWPTFEGGIGVLTNLRELAVHDNKLLRLPVDLGLITSLGSMPLENNPGMTSPPPEVVVRGHRIIMDYLRRVCDSVLQGSLDLSRLGLMKMPEDLLMMTHVSRLRLAENRIDEIDEGIKRFTNLTDLDMSANRITEIPAILGGLPRFHRISYEDNAIESPPVSIQNKGSDAVIAYLKRLWEGAQTGYLDLSGQDLSAVPVEILRMTSLTYLNLDHNGITQVPDGIASLIHLKSISLQDNAISLIPAQVCPNPKSDHFLNPNTLCIQSLFESNHSLNLRILLFSALFECNYSLNPTNV